MSSSDQRFFYNAKFKRSVIRYAEEHGNRAAGREFTVSEANVRRWRKDKDCIFACQSTCRSFSGPRSGWNPELEEAVASYVHDLRCTGKPVSMRTIILKAKEVVLMTSKRHRDGVVDLWFDSIFHFDDEPASICQKLPPHFEAKLVAYQRYIMRLRSEYSFALNQIANSDETPIHFDMPSNWTVADKGSKEVKLISAGYEKCRVTVMLAITGDGNKLPPYLKTLIGTEASISKGRHS